MKTSSALAIGIFVLFSSVSFSKNIEVKLWLNKSQDQLFVRGDRLFIHVETKQDAYLQIVYHDASNKSHLIFPNSGSSPDGKIRGNQVVTLGEGVDKDGFEFEIDEPFGAEMIRVYACSKPLPKPKGKLTENGVVEISSSLDALNVFYHDAASKAKAEFTDATVLLKTAEKNSERSPDAETKTIDVSKDVTATNAKPRVFGLVIGVSQYQSPKISALKYADADARIFSDFLQSKDGVGIPSTQMRFLVNERATRANILDAMESFLTQTTKKDMIIIYIACHGLTSMKSNATYFLNYDADLMDLPNTAVDQSFLTNILTQKVQAGKVVFFIDACHGGGLGLTGVRLRGSTSFLSSKFQLEIMANKNSTAFFSAARAMEQSVEGPQWGGGHGVFTHYVMEGLRKHGDANKNGIVTIDELADYVSMKVKEDTGGRQHPELKGYFDNELTLSVLR